VHAANQRGSTQVIVACKHLAGCLPVGNV
jgi:hypothetical protein